MTHTRRAVDLRGQWGTAFMFAMTVAGFVVIIWHMSHTGCHFPPKPAAWTWVHYDFVFRHACHPFTR